MKTTKSLSDDMLEREFYMDILALEGDDYEEEMGLFEGLNYYDEIMGEQTHAEEEITDHYDEIKSSKIQDSIKEWLQY